MLIQTRVPKIRTDETKYFIDGNYAKRWHLFFIVMHNNGLQYVRFKIVLHDL